MGCATGALVLSLLALLWYSVSLLALLLPPAPQMLWCSVYLLCSGTQFTCFSLVLSLLALLVPHQSTCATGALVLSLLALQFPGFQFSTTYLCLEAMGCATGALVLSLLAVLVRKYKY
jgi:hypothetical protein